MDILSNLEPQLAFPVVFAVVFAFLVYFFGFQKTQEPNFEKLALLQESKSHKSQVKHKPQQNVSTKKTTKDNSKPVANGHVVHDKEKNNVSSPKPKVAGKENKPPTTTTQQKTKGKKDLVADEDINSGDWTSVPTRKEKKIRKEERKVEDRKEVKKEKNSVDKKTSTAVSSDEPEEKQFSVEEIIEMANAQGKKIDLTGLSPTPSPKPQREKKVKAQAPAIPTTKKEIEKIKEEEEEVKEIVKVVEEPKKTSKKGKAPAPAPVLEKKKEVVVEKKKEEPATKIPDAKKPSTPAPAVQKQPEPVKEKVVQNGGGDEQKSNVVFDEIGDTWEEAKSRGAKKRRARKE